MEKYKDFNIIITGSEDDGFNWSVEESGHIILHSGEEKTSSTTKKAIKAAQDSIDQHLKEKAEEKE